ncbi:MAG TPA: hypothetical protein VG244_09480 [Acidimicrobiales bacterium]|nr:hypothetical protein [Acidimicrobiales bacterium]
MSADTVNPARLTLRPPPQPDPAVLAAIASAVQLAWPRLPEPDAQNPVHEAWRFSGRWWNKPVPISRDRPWARR